MKLKTWQTDLLKGSALGTGILPGVSVGTVGFIVNVYDKLIGSIAGLRAKKTFKSSLLALIPIALGCLVWTFIFIIFWKKLAYLYFPFITIAVLAGFVIGGLPIMTKELKGDKLGWKDFLRIALGFAIAAGIGIASYLSAAGIIQINWDFYTEFYNPFASPWIYALVLFMGFFSAVACLIPGISGSMVMYIFSMFNPILTIFISDRDPYDGSIIPNHASIFESSENVWARLLILVVLLVGMLVGFVSVSVAMKKLLANHRRGTFGFVVGFVCGSLVSMFVNHEMYWVYHDATGLLNAWWQFALGGVLGIGMVALTYYLVKKAEKRQLDNVVLKEDENA